MGQDAVFPGNGATGSHLAPLYPFMPGGSCLGDAVCWQLCRRVFDVCFSGLAREQSAVFLAELRRRLETHSLVPVGTVASVWGWKVTDPGDPTAFFYRCLVAFSLPLPFPLPCMPGAVDGTLKDVFGLPGATVTVSTWLCSSLVMPSRPMSLAQEMFLLSCCARVVEEHRCRGTELGALTFEDAVVRV